MWQHATQFIISTVNSVTHLSHDVDKTGSNEEDWNHHCADHNDGWSCENPEDHKQADNDRVQVVILEAAAERLEEAVAAVLAVNLWTGAVRFTGQ